ncbi:hypothetical protein BH18CHL2_BH18CHL2_08230 [soil metagenome]
MSAVDLVAFLTQAIYLGVFVMVVRTALQRPTKATLDIALFFAVIAFVITQRHVLNAVAIERSPLVTMLSGALFLTLPYLLLRLLGDFAHLHPPAKLVAEIGLGLSVLMFILFPESPLVLLIVWTYFFSASISAGLAFTRESRASRGVTKRRLQAVAIGSIFLGLSSLMSGLQSPLASQEQGLLGGLQQVLSLGAGIAFYLGFAPPRALWRAWQEPELRAFLSRAASLPRLPTTRAIIRELENGAAASIGAEARIGIADASLDVLRYHDRERGVEIDVAASRHLGGRAFTEQRAFLSMDPAAEDPEHAAAYPERGAGAVMAAPITAGDRSIGVLVAYAKRPPLFAENDLELVRLLADQAALMLESRALIDEAARIRAHEEVTRLKEEFLSAAAHDLKTPLTTLVAQAQFLERKGLRDPSAPADHVGLGRIVREAKRLNVLVLELLDASRLEQGGLIGERQSMDLVEAAQEVCERTAPERYELDAPVPVIGTFDRRRIAQVFNNLVENALKYSAKDTPIRVRIWEDGEAHFTIEDSGIGIPPADLQHVFERFRRASNVRDRHFSGMGLGLYICRGIVEAHGGRIWAESRLGQGSSFHVSLPLAEERIAATGISIAV